MLSVLTPAVLIFVCLYGVYQLVKAVTDEEDAFVVTVLLSFAVGLLMIDYIWPWGIF